MAIIGDMLPTQGLHNDMLHRRVVNFDEEAAAYAAWFHEGRPAQGNILTYILPQKALPAPQVPQSQWYKNGGAFFREKPDDPNGLHGVLYNITSQDEWHTHQETNGLALSGLGNRLLVNGGRLGAPTRAAALNNTLTINGNEHASRLGDGITEGFTSEYLDYACGASGRALPGHLRSLILVHASDGAKPYFLLLDEIATEGSERVHNYFHPANETSVKELSPGQIYQAPIDHYPTTSGANLGFFFVTPPEAVNIEKVPSAVPERYPNYPDHNRLEAIYSSARDAAVPIATVLFPHKNNEALPAFNRLDQDGVSGGILPHGEGTKDYILNTTGASVYGYQKVQFQGKSVLFREMNGALGFFFLREGNRFSHDNFSVESTEPMSMFLQDKAGALTTSGTQLTFKGPGVESIQFEPAVTELERKEGLLRVELPAGNFRME
jgi:hypothetical protein